MGELAELKPNCERVIAMAKIELIIDKLDGDQDYLDIEGEVSFGEVVIKKILGGMASVGDGWEKATDAQVAAMLAVVAKAIDADAFTPNDELTAVWFSEAGKAGETFGLTIKVDDSLLATVV